MVLATASGLFAAATFVPWPSVTQLPGPHETPISSDSGVCSGKALLLERNLRLKEDIVIRTGTGNANDWTQGLLFLEVGGTFDGRCNTWGDYLAVRGIAVTLRVQDDTSTFRAEETWLSGMGTEIRFRGGIADMHRDSPNLVGSDGRKHLESFAFAWTPSRANWINVTFPLLVRAVPAEPHVGDFLRFTLVLETTIGETLCAGACWSPFSSKHTTEVIVVETILRGAPV